MQNIKKEKKRKVTHFYMYAATPKSIFSNRKNKEIYEKQGVMCKTYIPRNPVMLGPLGGAAADVCWLLWRRDLSSASLCRQA